MEVVNLIDLIKSGEIFEKIEWKFEQIVSDYDFWDLENFIKINNFADLQNIDKNKKTLFILDKLVYNNIDMFWNMSDLTILDMNFGMDSLANKIGFSNTDICSLSNQNIDIYEPMDLISLINILSFDQKKYIRIPNANLAKYLSDDLEYNDFFDLSDKWFDGEDLCVLTTGAFLSETVRMMSSLWEKTLALSIIIINKLNLDFSKIKFWSKNIVFIIDLKKDSEYEKLIAKQLKWFNIKFIYPNYEKKIVSVLDEYKYENYCFDAQSILSDIFKTE